jgi:AraC-like DNA-binding protein
MFDLSSLYKPITAQAATFEGCMPCGLLTPFIANYWGTEGVSQEKVKFEPLLIIPDTCMDVIFDINHTTGAVNGQLCGMGETAITFIPTRTNDVVSRFAIRFYFWSIHFYSSFHLHDTADNYNDADLYFKGWKSYFTEMLLSTFTLGERIEKADRFLMSKLDTSHYNYHVMNALYHMLKNQGASSVKDICAYTCISQRQLERLFQEHIGTTVKKTANLVRYQNLWRDVAFQEYFDVQDAVLKYGYADQAHLINSFKGYHTMLPSEARQKIRLHI